MLALALTIFVALAACGSKDKAGVGTISGVVSIGPLCPVEPCDGVPNPYPDLRVIISKDDVVVQTFTPDETGAFTGELSASEATDYLMDLAPCDYASCAGVLPQRVTVHKDQTTSVRIDIDTGIR
jgi:hypothetical protein